MNVLNFSLISTLLIAPLLLKWLRVPARSLINQTEDLIIRKWIIFLIIIIFIRAMVGAIFMGGDFSHWSVQKFYPIRIAYPNYGILSGLPYVAIGFVILYYLRSICNLISLNRSRYFLLWAFSVVLSLVYGAIHGGLVVGNIGVSAVLETVHDATLNATMEDVFSTHIDRITGRLEPPFKAVHTISHPAGSLAYWQFMTNAVSPIFFSIFNVFILSLAFPVMYWALRRRHSDKDAIQVVICCMVTPAILVYGRSDDAVYYAFAASILAISYISIAESRYLLTLGVGVLLALAMNISYASFILLPALLSINTSERLNKIWLHMRVVAPHAIIMTAAVIIMIGVMQYYYNYNYFDVFLAAARHNARSNIVNMLREGSYWEIVNSRIMTVSDILLFGGPLFLYLFYKLLKNVDLKFSGWRIKNIALTVLMSVLMINSNGPGEISRPWGSIYLMIGFVWYVFIFNHETEKTRWWIIRIQLFWALMLQTLLNFGW